MLLQDLDSSKAYSYAEYLTWDIKEQVELIRGRLVSMTAAPLRIHQRISTLLVYEISKVIENSYCQLYHAPFDVRLFPFSISKPNDEAILTVVQPDLTLVCDKEKLDERGCLGAPELIIEILSPGNSKKDLQVKYDLYEESGVNEYWTLFPLDQVVNRYVLIAGKYKLYGSYEATDDIPISAVADKMIPLRNIFALS